MTLPRDPATIDGRHCQDVDPEAFFPPEHDMSGVALAKRICVGCPALDVCLEFAMHHENALVHSARSGVFGGMSARQRAQLYTKRARNGEAPKPRVSTITDTKECETCKATVRRHKQSKESWAKLRFCSRKCHGVTMRYQNMPETKACEGCGESFGQGSRHGKKWLAARFCGVECAGAARRSA